LFLRHLQRLYHSSKIQLSTANLIRIWVFSPMKLQKGCGLDSRICGSNTLAQFSLSCVWFGCMLNSTYPVYTDRILPFNITYALISSYVNSSVFDTRDYSFILTRMCAAVLLSSSKRMIASCILDFKLSPCSKCCMLSFGKFTGVWSLYSTHAYLPVKMEQSVPKRRHINFRRRGITQRKAYNIVDCTLTKLKWQNCQITSPDRPWDLQEVKAHRIFRQSAHEGGNVVNPTHRPPLPSLPPRRYSWYSFLLGTGSTPGP
jgi:hypothetical protein